MSGDAPRPLKVLVVIDGFLIGGAQKLLVDLFARMDRTRFAPVLATLYRSSERSDIYLYDALPADIPVHDLRFRSATDVAGWRALADVFRSEKPDAVLSHLFFSNTAARVLGFFFGVPSVAVEQNTYTGKKKLHQIVDFILSFFSYRIVAVSKTVADFTSRQEGIPRSRFVIIENGIDTDRLWEETTKTDTASARRDAGVAEGERVIINVSRIVPQKNHELLLRAFARFRLQHPAYALVIVGGGSEEERMKKLADELGIEKNVRFLGYRKDVPRFLAIADFFVTTSLIEGFGVAYAEALACGVPLVATKTAGPDEMVHEGENGFFIPEYTVEAAAEAMAKMAALNIKEAKEAARRSAEQYSIKKTVSDYQSLLAEAAGV